MTSDTAATQYAYLDSPIGRLLLAGRAGALSLIYFMSGPRSDDAGSGLA